MQDHLARPFSHVVNWSAIYGYTNSKGQMNSFRDAVKGLPDTCLDMTSHFQEIHGDSAIWRNSCTNYEHNYEVAFWDLYEEFLFLWYLA